MTTSRYTKYQVFWFCCGKFGYTSVVLLSYHHDAKLRWKWSRDCWKIEAWFAANIKKRCFILADLRFCYIQIYTCSSTGMFRSLLSLLSLHGWSDQSLKEKLYFNFCNFLVLELTALVLDTHKKNKKWPLLLDLAQSYLANIFFFLIYVCSHWWTVRVHMYGQFIWHTWQAWKKRAAISVGIFDFCSCRVISSITMGREEGLLVTQFRYKFAKIACLLLFFKCF